MSDELPSPNPMPDAEAAPASATQDATTDRNRAVGGIVLVIIGLMMLVGQLTNWTIMGWLIFPVLALIFLVWGLMTRSFGLTVPGGIFAGLGLGMFTMVGPLSTDTAAIQPGLFLICFGAGWVLITLLSPITDRKWVWWPLIPGAAIGLTGLALLAGDLGQNVLQLASYTWPLILVAIGAYLLLVRRK